MFQQVAGALGSTASGGTASIPTELALKLKDTGFLQQAAGNQLGILSVAEKIKVQRWSIGRLFRVKVRVGESNVAL